MNRLLPWITLKHAPGVGNLLFKRLIDHFGSPEAVLSADVDRLAAVDGISARQAKSILTHKISTEIEKDLELALKKKIKMVSMSDPEYPALLRELPDPPPVLYVDGTIDANTRNIAVVGSRHATLYGLANAERLSRELGEFGLCVVSGMARGIDTAAHRGALRSESRTVAILGSGLARIYPAENRRLASEIAANGAVVSEFPMMAEPEAHHFPMRNRIISGMSLGTVVVEATRKSGSLITARLALEQGREVFAVPGSIRSFKSTGTHGLLKQGAKLVEHALDVVEELTHVLQPTPAIVSKSRRRPAKKTVSPRVTPDEACVLGALEPYPLHIDAVARRTSMQPGKLSGILLNLELEGMVSQSPGKMFTICED